MFLSIVQLVAHAVVQSSFYFGKHSLICKLLHCAYVTVHAKTFRKSAILISRYGL